MPVPAMPGERSWRVCPICRLLTNQYRVNADLLFCPDCKRGSSVQQWRRIVPVELTVQGEVLSETAAVPAGRE